MNALASLHVGLYLLLETVLKYGSTERAKNAREREYRNIKINIFWRYYKVKL